MGMRFRAASVGARESPDVLRVPPDRAPVLVEVLSDGPDALATGLCGSNSVHFFRRSRRSARLCGDFKVLLPLGALRRRRCPFSPGSTPLLADRTAVARLVRILPGALPKTYLNTWGFRQPRSGGAAFILWFGVVSRGIGVRTLLRSVTGPLRSGQVRPDAGGGRQRRCT